jgi:PPM family protein phosphatase
VLWIAKMAETGSESPESKPPGEQAPLACAMAAHSDKGRVRESNEDNFALDQAQHVAVIADGMGGHAAGEVASSMATQEVVKSLAAARDDLAGLDPEAYEAAAHKIGQIVSAANRAILDRSAEEPDKRGMGTTLDAIIVLPRSAYVAHVGDSRVYWIRQGVVTPVTRDHSLAAALVESGRLTAEEAAPLEGVLVRALGISSDLAVDVARVEIQTGDALLLCTDGLWRYFPDHAELARTIGDHGAGAAEKLVEQAVERGGEDNATAIVVVITAATQE